MNFLKSKNKKEEEFNDRLSKYAEEMIRISWDYIDNNDDDLKMIYIVGAMELESYSFMTFYNFDNKITEAHETKNHSFERICEIQDQGIEILEEIVTHFKSHKKDIPTQIKIDYSFVNQQINYELEYDLIWSNKEEGGLPSDSYYSWLEEIKDDLNKSNSK